MKFMKLIAILILLSLLFSCEPDNSEMVITGSKNDNLEIVKLNPVISLPAYPFNASDSLDLNGDNLFEIKFIKFPIPSYTGFSTATLIVTQNKTQILLSRFNDYPDSIPINTPLEIDAFWSSDESSTFILQSYTSDLKGPNIGNFINVIDKYIGYKKGKKIGWIKIDNSRNGDLKIKEYTVIK